MEDGEVAEVEVEDGSGVEEASVEVFDGVLTVAAVGFGHCLEEAGELALEDAGGEAVVGLDQVSKDVFREQADVVCEEAEEQAHEEVGDLFAGVDGGVGEGALFEFEALGHAGEGFGGLLGDEGVGCFGAEARDFLEVEEGAEDFEGRQGAGGGDDVSS